jgi:hypothetical protein
MEPTWPWMLLWSLWTLRQLSSWITSHINSSETNMQVTVDKQQVTRFREPQAQSGPLLLIEEVLHIMCTISSRNEAEELLEFMGLGWNPLKPFSWNRFVFWSIFYFLTRANALTKDNCPLLLVLVAVCLRFGSNFTPDSHDLRSACHVSQCS